jgi:hypothetical protein
LGLTQNGIFPSDAGSNDSLKSSGPTGPRWMASRAPSPSSSRSSLSSLPLLGGRSDAALIPGPGSTDLGWRAKARAGELGIGETVVMAGRARTAVARTWDGAAGHGSAQVGRRGAGRRERGEAAPCGTRCRCRAPLRRGSAVRCGSLGGGRRE